MAISPRAAASMARMDFPAAVGPTITRILRSAKTPVYFAPRQLNDRGAAVNVMRGKVGIAKRDKQGAHLRSREKIPTLHCCLARDRRNQSLVTSVGRRRAVASQ